MEQHYTQNSEYSITSHWHTSSKESDVTYLALYGGTQPTSWTEVMSQEYYDSVAQRLKE